MFGYIIVKLTANCTARQSSYHLTRRARKMRFPHYSSQRKDVVKKLRLLVACLFIVSTAFANISRVQSIFVSGPGTNCPDATGASGGASQVSSVKDALGGTANKVTVSFSGATTDGFSSAGIVSPRNPFSSIQTSGGNVTEHYILLSNSLSPTTLNLNMASPTVTRPPQSPDISVLPNPRTQNVIQSSESLLSLNGNPTWGVTGGPFSNDCIKATGPYTLTDAGAPCGVRSTPAASQHDIQTNSGTVGLASGVSGKANAGTARNISAQPRYKRATFVRNAGIQYVAPWGNDSNDGFSWGSAKATLASACLALPSGNSECSSGSGTIYFQNGVVLVGGAQNPYADVRAYGANCDGSTDDGTANTTAINSTAANGGTALLCNNTIWTPGLFTAPSYWATIALGGKATVKRAWTLPSLTALKCHDPELGALNVNFSWRPNCFVATSPSAISPVLTTGKGNYLENIGVGGGTSAVLGIYDPNINTHFNNVFSDFTGNPSGSPYESYRGSGSFGHIFDDGAFETGNPTSTNPSMLFHTTSIIDLHRTFLNGNGIKFETAAYPSSGEACGDTVSYFQLYENAPVWTTANAAMFTFDLTGCTFVNPTIINPMMADAADTTTPLINVTRSSGSSNLKELVLINPDVSGPYFAMPQGNSNYIGGVTILGGDNANWLGLYGVNANYTLLNGAFAMFSAGGPTAWPTGVSNTANGVALPSPYQLSCSASRSGGSFAAGTYYVDAAYEDTLGLEGQVSEEQGPFVLTGSTSSISCSWNEAYRPVSSVVATRLFTGTAPNKENVRYRTTISGGPYTIPGDGGTSVSPTQMYPSSGYMAYLDLFGDSCEGPGCASTPGNEWLGLAGNVGVGTQSPAYKLDVNGSTRAITYNTNTNCSSSASPAACGSAAAGSVSIAAGSSSVVVSTTAVTGNSEIQLTFDSSLGTKLSLTCNTTPQQPTVTARSPGVSFTLSVSRNFATHPGCFSYSVIN